jgi:hypothetical protein
MHHHLTQNSNACVTRAAALRSGIRLGGQWDGAVLWSSTLQPERRGLYGSFVTFGLPTGLILANLVFLFLQGPYMGSMPAAFSELFPAAVRLVAHRSARRSA